MMKKSLKWAGITASAAGTMLQLGGCGLLAPLGLGMATPCRPSARGSGD